MNNDEIIKNLTAPNTIECLKKLKEKKHQTINHYKIDEGVSPYNLFLYLSTRFGSPNGMLSLVRKEDSDQLFHWHYSLYVNNTSIEIMCATYKIEVFISENLASTKEECIILLNDFIQDIKSYSVKVNKTKKDIENWEMLINPFSRIQQQINILIDDIETLNDKIPDFEHSHIAGELDTKTFTEWTNLIEEVSAKLFALKCLTPVYIETFVNFIIEILCKDEIKNNPTKFESIIRENINIKIQSLPINCIGFCKKIDFENDEVFKKIYTIFNERNDLLHGNFKRKQLKYGEVSFIKKMPLFKKISSFQEDILITKISSGNLSDILHNIEAVQMFFRYILLDLDDKIRNEVKLLLESNTLGWNKCTKRFGILFNDNLIDYKVY